MNKAGELITFGWVYNPNCKHLWDDWKEIGHFGWRRTCKLCGETERHEQKPLELSRYV